MINSFHENRGWIKRNKHNGVWCNGSINALGAFSPGSNPGTPNEEKPSKIC